MRPVPAIRLDTVLGWAEAAAAAHALSFELLKPVCVHSASRRLAAVLWLGPRYRRHVRMRSACYRCSVLGYAGWTCKGMSFRFFAPPEATCDNSTTSRPGAFSLQCQGMFGAFDAVWSSLMPGRWRSCLATTNAETSRNNQVIARAAGAAARK